MDKRGTLNDIGNPIPIKKNILPESYR